MKIIPSVKKAVTTPLLYITINDTSNPNGKFGLYIYIYMHKLVWFRNNMASVNIPLMFLIFLAPFQANAALPQTEGETTLPFHLLSFFPM